MLKWGSTEVTVLKWGNTTCTAAYWGSTKVFPTNNGYDGSSYVAPIASGLQYYTIYTSARTTYTGTEYFSNTASNTSLRFPNVGWVSTAVLTPSQWNVIKQIRIVARFRAYIAVDESNLYIDSSNLFFGANSPSLTPVICPINTTSEYTSSLTYTFSSITEWEQLFVTSYYYSSVTWTAECLSDTHTNSQGGDVIVTSTTTIANNHVPRVPSNAYMGFRIIASVSNSSPSSGAYKKGSIQLQSIEILSYIKY